MEIRGFDRRNKLILKSMGRHYGLHAGKSIVGPAVRRLLEWPAGAAANLRIA
jgi:hypothetical protein